MPATWLGWQVSFEIYNEKIDSLNIFCSRSMIVYIVCIMSFVWRTGTTDDANRGPMTPEDAIAFRILVSVVLSLGVIYFVLIASTLRKYGKTMDQAWRRRIIAWMNDTVATATYGSGYIPTTPVPLVDPHIRATTPSKHQPPVESGFDPTLNLHPTDPYQESTSPTLRSKRVPSAHTCIQHGSNFPLRSPGPHGEFNLVGRNGHGTDNKNHVHGSQSVSKDKAELKIRSSDASPPLPSLCPVPVPTPAHPRDLSKPIPDEGYPEIVINPNLSQEPIKLVKLLSLSFEGDHPHDVPPSEDELKACHIMKELWKELHMVSPISI